MGNIRGFTIVEVLIATALVGVAAVGMSNLFVGQNRQMRVIQVKSNFDQIRNVVQSTAKDPDSIRRSANCSLATSGCDFSGWTNDLLAQAEGITGAEASAPANQSLFRCVLPVGTSKQCQTQVTSPAFLFSPDGRLITGLYTLNGVHCKGAVADTKCPIQVTTFVLPTCPISPDLTVGGVCNRAQSVQIGWKVEQVVDLPNIPHLKTIQATFTNSNGNDAAYAAPVSTLNIQGTQDAKISCDSILFTANMLKPAGKYDPGMYGGLVGTMVPQTITDMDAYGQAVCGIDEGALEANLLKKELCMSQIQNVWYGRFNASTQSTTPSCDLTVVKNFKLAGNPGNENYFTADCLADSTRRLRNGATGPLIATIDQTYGMTGGVLKHLNGTLYTAAETTVLMSQYSLTSSDSMDGKLTCLQSSPKAVYWPGGDTSPNQIARFNAYFQGKASFSLPADFVPGSLQVQIIGGGGGGGGGHNGHSNGNAGSPSTEHDNSYGAATPNATCSLVLGHPGGAGDGNNCSGGDNGTNGGTTTFSCTGGSPMSSVGGSGGASCGGNFSAGNKTFHGQTANASASCGGGGWGAVNFSGGGGTAGEGCAWITYQVPQWVSEWGI